MRLCVMYAQRIKREVYMKRHRGPTVTKEVKELVVEAALEIERKKDKPTGTII